MITDTTAASRRPVTPGNPVELRVAGQRYSGWKTARVTRGIEQIAGSFELSVTERWAEQGKPWPIGEGDECEVFVDGQPVITGYLDKRAPSFDAKSHAISVSGRDRAGDLVDCSVILDRWHFTDTPVLALAKKICAPFGIDVALQPGLVLGPETIPKKHSIDPGDTAHSALETVCKLAGVLPVSDGQGGIVLTRAGTDRCDTALIEGENLLSGAAEYDYSGRFARYLVLGQHKGNDEFNGAASAAVSGRASDPNVTRSERVLVIRPEGNVTAAQAKTRAEWEATTRAARGDSATFTVQGWKQSSGALWPVNTRVPVQSPTLGINGELLISQVTLSLSLDGGQITTLVCKRPDAFLPQPTAQGVAGDGTWKEIRRGALTGFK